MKSLVLGALFVCFATFTSRDALGQDLPAAWSTTPGVLVQGEVTVDPSPAPAQIVFLVEQPSTSITVGLLNERAFSEADTDTLSFQWAKALSQSQKVSIRLFDQEELAPDTVVTGFYPTWAVCTVGPTARKAVATASRLLKCISFDEGRRWSDAGGDLRYEMNLIVSTSTDSPLDRYLRRFSLSDHTLVHVWID
jgi:hypothetical protein